MFVPTLCPAGVGAALDDDVCEAPVTVVVVDDMCGEVHGYCDAHALTHGPATGCPYPSRYFRIA
jgi:hypothetical protein